MSPSDATAEVFLKAFVNMPRPARDSFIVKMLRIESLREDIIDIAVANKRLKEKTRPFQKVVETLLKNRKK
ncbi:MAG: hypothetical protein AABZ57_06195 [Candidatus Margulisiibacteriota bacterium]